MTGGVDDEDESYDGKFYILFINEIPLSTSLIFHYPTSLFFCRTHQYIYIYIYIYRYKIYHQQQKEEE